MVAVGSRSRSRARWEEQGPTAAYQKKKKPWELLKTIRATCEQLAAQIYNFNNASEPQQSKPTRSEKLQLPPQNCGFLEKKMTCLGHNPVR